MGIKEFQGSLKNVFSFENLAILLTFGLFTTQVIISVLNKWFGNLYKDGPIPEFFAGPYLMLLVVMAGVFLAFAILRRTWAGIYSKSAIAMVLVTGVIIIFLLLKMKNLENVELFKDSAASMAAMLGIG